MFDKLRTILNRIFLVKKFEDGLYRLSKSILGQKFENAVFRSKIPLLGRKFKNAGVWFIELY